jgi:hypothetical protein
MISPEKPSSKSTKTLKTSHESCVETYLSERQLMVFGMAIPTSKILF